MVRNDSTSCIGCYRASERAPLIGDQFASVLLTQRPDAEIVRRSPVPSSRQPYVELFLNGDVRHGRGRYAFGRFARQGR
jgi:hypothetical protein